MSAATIQDSRVNKTSFVLYTVVAALVTAVATWASAALHFQVWVTFMGFIAWYTRPVSMRASVSALACLWLGVGVAVLAALATKALTPMLGAAALALVVFVVAVLIVSLRAVAVVDNLLCWFLGLVTFFAAGAPFSPLAIVILLSATALGGFAGWACQVSTSRWAQAS